MNEQIFMSVSKSELSEIIAKAVSESLCNLSGNPEPESKYLLIKEAAAKIKKTPTAIHKMVVRGQIPSLKRGRTLYFLEKDLDEWMLKGRRELPQPENPSVYLKKKGG